MESARTDAAMAWYYRNQPKYEAEMKLHKIITAYYIKIASGYVLCKEKDFRLSVSSFSVMLNSDGWPWKEIGYGFGGKCLTVYQKVYNCSTLCIEATHITGGYNLTII